MFGNPLSSPLHYSARGNWGDRFGGDSSHADARAFNTSLHPSPSEPHAHHPDENHDKKSISELCNDKNAVAFVHKHRDDCQKIADQLGVPVENILGLAAEETLYGQGRIGREDNNYFSMHTSTNNPAPLQI